METSLIGKALNFGFNDYGFESRVSSLSYNYAPIFVLNAIKINKAKKLPFFKIKYTRKVFFYVKLFNSLNYIYRFEILKINNCLYLQIYLNYINLNITSVNLKLYTKPSHFFFISLKALKLLDKKIGNSLFLISTTYGVITHRQAISKNTGGLLYGFYSL